MGRFGHIWAYLSRIGTRRLLVMAFHLGLTLQTQIWETLSLSLVDTEEEGKRHTGNGRCCASTSAMLSEGNHHLFEPRYDSSWAEVPEVWYSMAVATVDRKTRRLIWVS